MSLAVFDYFLLLNSFVNSHFVYCESKNGVVPMKHLDCQSIFGKVVSKSKSVTPFISQYL